jgi:hypothetical protein
MRISAFVFLHRLRHGADRAAAERDLEKIWQPGGVWQEFVNQRLAETQQKAETPVDPRVERPIP